MLGTVKSFISDLPDMTFNLYFVNYIIRIQDEDLENEFKYLTSHNNISISKVDKLIENTYEGLVSI